MRIQFILPKWSMSMPWVGAIKKTLVSDHISFLESPTPEADIHVYMWCENIQPLLDIPCIVYLRRYEFFNMAFKEVDWDRIAHVIFVNTDLMYATVSQVPSLTGKTSVIYNCFDPDIWTYKQRGHGKKIAMVGHVNYRKNIPMALQIKSRLPRDYELHIAGKVHQYEIPAYTRIHATDVHFHGEVRDLDSWLCNKDYLLHCSVSEGNPNCVIEAMAKGIKPIVHTYPGAREQLPKECLFDTIDEAIDLMDSGYHSSMYREWAEENFSIDNLLSLREVIEHSIRGAIV